MLRTVSRELPDGSIRSVQPFHISMEGLEKMILCQDDDDYDAMVKALCVCAKRKNVIVIIYAVVSIHCHAAVLTVSQYSADSFGEEVKRVYSMWLHKKYGLRSALKKVDVKAIYLDSDWYVRNALAYIPRNSIDNGCNVNEYPWSGFRAMFASRPPSKQGVLAEGCRTVGCEGRSVSKMSKNERRRVMHTGDKLDGVDWLVDDKERLIPESFCDHSYLEQAFEHDQAFFLKTIGGQNSAEMKHKLVDSPRIILTDNEFLKVVEELSERWFGSSLSDLSQERKIRLIPYVNRTMKTTVPQLARVFGIGRDGISGILGRNNR